MEVAAESAPARCPLPSPGLTFGFLAAALLLGLILFIHQRDRSYLYAFLYACGLSYYVAVREHPLGAPGVSGLAALSSIALALIPIGGTLTHLRLLQTREHWPRLHRWLLAATGLAAIANAGFWQMPVLWRLPLIGAANLAWMLSLLAVILARLTQGTHAAAYLLPAWLALGSARASVWCWSVSALTASAS